MAAAAAAGRAGAWSARAERRGEGVGGLDACAVRLGGEVGKRRQRRQRWWR